MRKRGSLTPEDKEVWSKVAKSADPLRCAPIYHTETEAKPSRQPQRPVKVLTRIGSVKPEARVTVNLATDPMAVVGTQMDRKNYDRLRKGKIRPDAKLDMHGMTADRAHSELTAFIHRSYAQGKRLALVITGKGNAPREDVGFMPMRQGILKHSLPHWLNTADMRAIILEVTTAHGKHGGDGAFYVYLKRQR